MAAPCPLLGRAMNDWFRAWTKPSSRRRWSARQEVEKQRRLLTDREEDMRRSERALAMHRPETGSTWWQCGADKELLVKGRQPSDGRRHHG